jgi:hypothetical protein
MKAPIAQFCTLLGNAPDCAVGAFIGYHGQKRIKKLGLPLGSHFTVTGNFNLNMMLKIEF